MTAAQMPVTFCMRVESTPTDAEQALRKLVELHTVRYEVYYQQGKVGDELVETGFQLNLLASHDHGLTSLTPGCPLCISTFNDLRTIATWILPKERRPSEYTIEPFDSALRMDSVHKMRPEVQLAIKIEHRGKKDQPLDDCEWRCLGDMEAALERLGVRKSRAPTRSM
jgi:hypothetical protein